jgi:hypothetical protein
MVSSGIITTIAGNGSGGFSGDGGPASQAQLFLPFDVASDAMGNVYIADEGNSRVREVLAAAPTTLLSPLELAFTASSGGAPTRAQQILFTASVSGLPFSVQGAPAWLAVTPQSGVSPRLISVTADPSSLAAQTEPYSATITINSPNGNPPSSTIAVTFTVTPGMPPTLAPLDKNHLSFPYSVNGTAGSQTLTVSNSGGAR